MIGSRSETMGQADFLQMLTAQLKAQDPMNPLQGQEFASQLAQFSSLQELQKMGQTADQTLQANILLAQTFNNTMASSLIGKTVRADLDQVALGASGSAGLSYTLPSPATEIKIEIKDSDGKTVRTLNVNPQAAGDHTVEWDGVDSNGHRVSAGNYTYTISAKGADGADVKASTFVEGRVSSVRYENGNAVLTVGGMTVMLGQVISISESGSDNASKRG
jgi:flagellar basal-body rod modification protein FlgD